MHPVRYRGRRGGIWYGGPSLQFSPKTLAGWRRSGALLRRKRQQLPFEVVVPLVEVQVAAVPFGFTALEVDRLRAEVGLGRDEVAAVVIVEGDAVGVHAAEVEVLECRVVAGQAAEGDVHRQPAVGRQVHPAP